MADITDLEAEKVIDACTKKATEIHTKMDIAVVDVGGNSKACLRMDGAWLLNTRMEASSLFPGAFLSAMGPER
jgi:uncharacterized protein GlcG (DUF336 family)